MSYEEGLLEEFPYSLSMNSLRCFVRKVMRYVILCKRNIGASENSTLVATKAHVRGQNTPDQRKPNKKCRVWCDLRNKSCHT